jgi:DNA helicase-2/ATP-dependent DNA helicase PcrA
MDEGGQAGLEEERRLAYVGLTRAKKRILVTFAANRRIYNQWQAAMPSRFLDELHPDHVERAAERGLYAGGGQSSARWNGDGWSGSRQVPPVIEANAWKISSRQPSAAHFDEGDRVFHQKFGNGTVVAIDGDKLEIAFDHAGTKKVLDSFVELV